MPKLYSLTHDGDRDDYSDFQKQERVLRYYKLNFAPTLPFRAMTEENEFSHPESRLSPRAASSSTSSRTMHDRSTTEPSPKRWIEVIAHRHSSHPEDSSRLVIGRSANCLFGFPQAPRKGPSGMPRTMFLSSTFAVVPFRCAAFPFCPTILHLRPGHAYVYMSLRVRWHHRFRLFLFFYCLYASFLFLCFLFR